MGVGLRCLREFRCLAGEVGRQGETGRHEANEGGKEAKVSLEGVETEDLGA